MTETQCYEKAVEADPNNFYGWLKLGIEGGGTVKGVAYTETQCYEKAVELNPHYAGQEYHYTVKSSTHYEIRASATGLLAMDIGGKSDPYFKMHQRAATRGPFPKA